jgi:hypothetical protein
MCGIVGVIQYESKVPRELRYKALRILFSELMLKNELRGKDATGLYQVMASGDWLMTKKAQRAADWLFLDRQDPKCEDPIVYADIMGSWAEHPEELRAVIGHCRAKTVGNTDNENNHPFAIQLDEKNALLGVHNGTLFNHEIIFSRLPKIIERQGSVDSEAIFHFLYYLTNYGKAPITPDTIKHLGKRLDGAYACVVVNSRFPNQISVFRDGRPMELFMLAPLNVVVLASERRIIESALDKYEFIRRLVDPELPALETENRVLPDKDFRIFDASKKFPEGKPSWNDFDEISEKGEIRKFNGGVEENWKDPKNASTSRSTFYGNSRSNKYSRPAGSQSTNTEAGTSTAPVTAARATKPATSATPGTKAIPATAGKGTKPGVAVDAETSETVQLEIGSEEEARRGYEKARSLGVCVHYDTAQEVAEALGRDGGDLARLDVVVLANALSKTHFNLGYAASRVDTKNEVSTIRSKAREQLSRLEKAEEKKKRAQNHLWEYKIVIQILLALNEGQYNLDVKNVECVLDAFPSLSEQRRKDVLRAAEELLTSAETGQLVARLQARFKEAEQREKREQTVAN